MKFFNVLFLLLAIAFSDIALMVVDIAHNDSTMVVDLAFESEHESESEGEVELKKEAKVHKSFEAFLLDGGLDLLSSANDAEARRPVSPLRKIPCPPPDFV